MHRHHAYIVKYAVSNNPVKVIRIRPNTILNGKTCVKYFLKKQLLSGARKSKQQTSN